MSDMTFHFCAEHGKTYKANESCPDCARNLALSALDAKAQAEDLLKPTEERVRECLNELQYERARHWEGSLHHIRIQEAMSLLETLLSDHKALREALKDVRARVFKTDIDGDPWIIQSKIDKALAASEKEGK